jgi:L-rhamnonate dehydratase
VYWLEEMLHPDDYEGYRAVKVAAPWVRWAAGEHEYTRYGFRDLIVRGGVDVVQPDPMYVGGMTEMLRIAGLAAAYDVPVIPHCGGPYSYHFAAAQPGTPFVEYINLSPSGDRVVPVFGRLFSGESLPVKGEIVLSNEPGWGLTVNRDDVVLRRPYVGRS